MKVGLVVPGGVDRSGTERVIPCLLWLIERLTAAGVELHVFALSQESEPGRWQLLGATVHNAGRPPRRLRLIGQILEEHRRARFDVLHAVWAAPSGVVAAAARALTGTPVLLHVTGGDLTSLRDIAYGARARWQGRMLVRGAIAAADRVTVPSAYLEAQARALGMHAERLTYGVALDAWPPLPPRPRDGSRPARLLSVGTINLVKDPWLLVRAAALLRAAGHSFQLDVVGEDTLGGSVQQSARAAGLGDVVQFHGFLPHARLRPLVEAADLLLVTSRHEGDPIALLEAAVAGVPAVGTAVGHLVEWAPHAGLAVPPSDHAALAAAVAELLDDDERRLRLARRAQSIALALDADRTAANVLRHYVALTRRLAAAPPEAIWTPVREPIAAPARLVWMRREPSDRLGRGLRPKARTETGQEL